MHLSILASPHRFLALSFAAGCLAASGLAQSQTAHLNPPAPASLRPSPGARDTANAALLAQASKLYYSSAKAGLAAFDCNVRPDWRGLFLSAQPGAAIADDDPQIVLLRTAKITLHGRLTGDSTLDWNIPADPAKPLDKDSADMIKGLHEAWESKLLGFMQFWTPFIDGSVIPATSDGLDITNTQKGHTIHADQGGTSLTEVLDNDLVMQQFNVATGGAKIDFSPRYKPTDQGLLVNAFLAKILPPSTPPDQAEEMQVEIDYQTVNGFPLPSNINMEVNGQGKFTFALDSCMANPR